MTQNPYQVLGVPNGADLAECTQAYKRLAKKYHPDLNPGDRVAGGADRQPLGNALYNTQHNGLEYFNNQIHILYCLPYRFFYCNRPAASCTEIL